MNVNVSCAIPTIGREETLPSVLNSIAFQRDRVDELILLDESPNPVTENFAVSQALDWLSILGVRVVVLRERNRKGIGPARYRLCEEARNEFVLQVDDDVVLHPECLNKMFPFIGQEYRWVVPTCLLVSSTYSSEGYLDQEIYSDDPRVAPLTEKYPWYKPYFRYLDPQEVELPMAGTQAILLNRDSVLKECEGLLKLGKLPREDTYLTTKLAPGMFVSPALCVHYEHPTQRERGNWSKEVFYQLHYSVNEMPENYVTFMGGITKDV